MRLRNDKRGMSGVAIALIVVALFVVLLILAMALAGAILAVSVIFSLIGDTNHDGETELLVGTITLEEKSATEVECRFGKFSKATKASDVRLVVFNGTDASYYDFQAATGSDGAWTTPSDDANTGSSIFFIDLGEDGNINSGDHFRFASIPGEEYQVKVIVEGDEICADEIHT